MNYFQYTSIFVEKISIIFLKIDYLIKIKTIMNTKNLNDKEKIEGIAVVFWSFFWSFCYPFTAFPTLGDSRVRWLCARTSQLSFRCRRARYVHS